MVDKGAHLDGEAEVEAMAAVVAISSRHSRRITRWCPTLNPRDLLDLHMELSDDLSGTHPSTSPS